MVTYINRLLARAAQRRSGIVWYSPFDRAEIMSIGDFERLYQKNPDQIESVEVIPPEIGSSGFGAVAVRRSRLHDLEMAS